MFPAATAADRASKAKSFFNANAYLQHVRYLASDELAGRAPGSDGAKQAAEYVMEHLEHAGCRPAGTNGTWYQEFPIRWGKQIIDAQARLDITGLDRRWIVRRDWIPFPFTARESVEGPLAFAGYGIAADDQGYNDYDGFDATGKVLLVLRHEPKADDPDAEFGGDTPSRNAFFVTKAREAAQRGAKALIVVDPPTRDPEGKRLFAFDSKSQETYSIPMVHVTREVADAILAKAGMPGLAALQGQLDSERKPLSKDLGMRVTLDPGVEAKTIMARNVIGMLPGNGSTDETIVVGAHRDHLGVVPRQFQRKDMTPLIHNGADDNASGTAAILELASAIGNSPKLRRNVLFIAFDGEEMGLLGSRHFANHPTVPLDDIRAMVNFDMIGRLRQDKYTVFGVPTGKEFPALVKKHAALTGLEYRAPKRVSACGDHTPFYKRNIPALFAFTGIHWDYHQPEDDWDRIDAEGATQVLDMWYGLILELANMTDGPTFTKPSKAGLLDKVKDILGGLGEGDADDDRAPTPGGPPADGPGEARSPDDTPSRSEMRVRFGVIPDVVGDDQPGMAVQSVLPGGPADRAGMQDGDRIIEINGEKIPDMYGYLRVLQDSKPGDVMDVVVLRAGKEVTLQVKLVESTYKRRNQ